MFKFEIVESPQKIFKNHLRQGMIERMKFYQGIELPLKSHLNPLFIIAEGPNKKMLGGACLHRKEICEIHEDLSDLLETLVLDNNYIWECSTVYLELTPHYPVPDTPEGDLFSQDFYRGLYEELVNFGIKKKINFIIMKLNAQVYFSTKEIGLWPYVVEIKPQISADGLFHGILPLRGSQYDSYHKIWGTCGPSHEANLNGRE